MMARFSFAGLAVLAVLLCFVTACQPKDAAPTGKSLPKILVLIEESQYFKDVDGKGFDEKEFFEMLDAMPGFTYDRAEIPKDMHLLAPGLEKKYDAILSYDQNHHHKRKDAQGKILVTDAHLANFEKLMQNGMPLLVLHRSVGSYPKWTTYREIAGGAFIFPGAVPFYKDLDGKDWPQSEYIHDVEMNIIVADKDHPITQGIDDFVIHDEVYQGMYVNPDVHVLLTTDYPDTVPPVAWVHRYGNSPVFTFIQGHDKQAFTNENYQKLVKQGIEWLIAEKEKSSVQ